MLTLGIMDSHLSSAAVVNNGRLVAAVREEVITRAKCYARFPTESVRTVLAQAGATGADVDLVCFGMQADLFDTPRFQISERDCKRDAVATAVMLLPRCVVRSDWLRRGWIAAIGSRRRRRTLAEQAGLFRELGLRPERTRFYEHHLTHAATAIFLGPHAGRQDLLIMVCDSYGDGQAGGVWTVRGGRLELIDRVPFADSLGSIYSRATRALGMKPWEHEYKVMGLAPYGRGERGEQLLQKLRGLFCLRDGRLCNPTSRIGMYMDRAMESAIRGYRFDHVAYAVQRLTEEVLAGWVAHYVRRTGIRRVGLAGGVFLNAKANQAIAALPEVDDVFIMPPAGDDSASVGAALAGWAEAVGFEQAWREAQPLQDLYLGPPCEPGIEAALAAHAGAGYEVSRPGDLEAEVARLLAAGEIVARCTGRAEFGPRALGNRSILCPAHDLMASRRLNDMIKRRDYWMPFAATVLDTDADRYLVNPKHIAAPFMILTLPTTPAGQSDLAAALLPADGTTRPQVLTREANPSYYRLLSLYAGITGKGALLNTSFNRHGEPMVLTAADALDTFARSELRYLALGPCLIKKKTPGR